MRSKHSEGVPACYLACISLSCTSSQPSHDTDQVWLWLHLLLAIPAPAHDPPELLRVLNGRISQPEAQPPCTPEHRLEQQGLQGGV
jgi:hypothetical protein